MKTIPLVLFSTCFGVSTLLAACTPPQEPVAEATAPTEDPALPVVTPPAIETTVLPTNVTVGADYPVARDACLAAVAKKTGVAQEKLVATEVLWAEAGVGVTVQVPEAEAPWSCLSDEKGNVQGAAYTGSEGKL